MEELLTPLHLVIRSKARREPRTREEEPVAWFATSVSRVERSELDMPMCECDVRGSLLDRRIELSGRTWALRALLRRGCVYCAV